MLRILLSAGNILLSLILGALLMALVAVYSPETLSVLLAWADSGAAPDDADGRNSSDDCPPKPVTVRACTGSGRVTSSANRPRPPSR